MSRYTRRNPRRAPPRRRRSRSPSTSTGPGRRAVSTGVPFFDHMLAQLGRHGGFDLEVQASGDLDVDGHHTVEDVGILLGECLRRGAGRQGRRAPLRVDPFPLDEALVEVALDLSGRPFCVYEVEPAGERPRATRPSTRSWPSSSGGRSPPPPASPCTCPAPRQEHPPHPRGHFKGVARCLRDAVRVEGAGVPSTKGDRL